MFTKRTIKTTDLLGRYYTTSQVSSALVQAMPVLTQRSLVLDLGAGSGSLSEAASRLWKDASFITVDIDDQAGCATLAELQSSVFRHHRFDALAPSLASHIGLTLGSVDAAICNPPYLVPRWRKHFAEILEDARLSHVLPRIRDVSSEVLFVAQNLRFLKSGGRLGLILPDTIVSGEKYQAFRQSIASTHCIEKIVELPRRAFRKTDAKAHIIILSKDKQPSEYFPVMQLRNNGSLSPSINVSACEDIGRLDYSYLAGLNLQSKRTNMIGDSVDLIVRGSFSSAQRKEALIPIFHTCDFEKSEIYVPARFNLKRHQLDSFNGTVAVGGDILVARVGRNLSEKVCKVRSHQKVATSDSVLLLRPKKELRQQIFDFLRSEDGQTSLEHLSQGVSAKFVTIRSIRELKF